MSYPWRIRNGQPSYEPFSPTLHIWISHWMKEKRELDSTRVDKPFLRNTIGYIPDNLFGLWEPDRWN